jgi:epoxyqueuosine reductase
MIFHERFSQAARDLGFIAVGFCRSGPPPFLAEYNRWVDAGKYGEMEWLRKHRELKADPGNVLEHCATVIMLAYPYGAEKPCTPGGLTAARYTRPLEPDYHESIKATAQPLLGLISKEYPGERSRICIDSAPLLERGFAWAVGIGFIGKNNMLIIPGHGSYLFLAELLTTALLPIPAPKRMVTLCGSCRRCVDACPTGALEGPFSLNAEKCLSYLTVEKKGPIDSETGKKMGECFFGCDVCQEVCPFNRDGGKRLECLPPAGTLLHMNRKTFEARFGKTVFARAGLDKIKSNIRAVAQGAFRRRP